MAKYFKTFWGPFWACPNLDKNELSERKALSVLKYSNYLPLRQKSEKTNALFLRKMLN